MEKIERIDEIDTVYYVYLELLELGIAYELFWTLSLAGFIERNKDLTDLLWRVDVLRPIKNLLDAAFPQILGNVGCIQFSHFTEIETSVYFLPALEKIILLILHLLLFLFLFL